MAYAGGDQRCPSVIRSTFIQTYLRLDDHVQRSGSRGGPDGDGAQRAGEMQERVFGHGGRVERGGRVGGSDFSKVSLALLLGGTIFPLGEGEGGAPSDCSVGLLCVGIFALR